MVHALEEIHRLLKPGGTLIDIHPVLDAPLIEVMRGSKVLFAEPMPAHDAEDFRYADAAVAQAVQRGLFAVEQRGEFDFMTYASSVAELRDYLEDANAYEDRSRDKVTAAKEAVLAQRAEGIMRSAGRRARVIHHEKARIVRLRPMRQED